MTYIVKDECIKCKLTDCVEVCPVDCFYEGENFLMNRFLKATGETRLSMIKPTAKNCGH